MSAETIRVEREGALAWLTLNRPERLNAMNPQLVAELRAYFAQLPNDRDTRVVILRGAGRAFCTGLDLKEPQGASGAGVAEGLRLTKECLNASIDAGSLDTVIAVEDRNQILCAQTKDFRESLAAFLEKRAPSYADESSSIRE